MKNMHKMIEEDLIIDVGVGATRHIGSDAYPYYVSEVLPNGIIGMYRPDSHFERDWTDGNKTVDAFDSSHKSDFYVRRSYGSWWKCTTDGKRLVKWSNVKFGSAYSYLDPSF